MDYDIKHDLGTIKMYIEKWGPDIPLYELLNLVKCEYKYECPLCKGKQFKNDCELCKGMGYTKIKYVPKMIQDGWIDENDSSEIMRLIKQYK